MFFVFLLFFHAEFHSACVGFKMNLLNNIFFLKLQKL